MKIKNISVDIAEDKAVLLGALGLIVYNTISANTSLRNSGLPAMYEVDSEGNPVENKQNKNYIGMITQALSANDYSAIKTLYKLQSVMDDLGAVALTEAVASKTDLGNITDVLSDITPFLSDSRKATVSNIADNIKKAKRTVEQIESAKTRINSLPSETPRTEKIKAIINEIPAISGIPILDNLNNIKSLLSMVKPEGLKASSEDSEETDNEASSNYDDIFELVGLIEEKNK